MQHNYNYNLPRETFNLLEKTFGSKEKAEIFADAMEKFLGQIDERATFMITDKLGNIRFEIKEDLTKSLVTREIFEERFKTIEERFKSINDKFDEKFKNLNFRFTILIALVIAALTFANPAFIKLLERLLF